METQLNYAELMQVNGGMIKNLPSPSWTEIGLTVLWAIDPVVGAVATGTYYGIEVLTSLAGSHDTGNEVPGDYTGTNFPDGRRDGSDNGERRLT
ncbi:MAG TPA: hypothetical protein VGS03_08395 [Candidatus Polarisedimenticolia bacterium]|jgi:hypothetical protein|nr:hypothetical protein [Candidatus Polarisedimenticolia bacterium]